MSNIVIAVATVAYVVLTVAVVVFLARQTRAQQKAVKLQIFHMIVERMENTRAYRQTLRDYIKKSKLEHEKVPFPPPEEIKEAADKVSREFDYLGLLDRIGMVDSRLVDLFYSVPFVFLYKDLLNEYISELRKPESRGPTHFWELVQFYNRVKNVPDNHPGLSGNLDWPKDARKSEKQQLTQAKKQI